MALEKLSPVLISCVASFLEQVDLLNIALTCKYLKETTEPELYRVFQYRSLRGQNIAEFVLMLVRRPAVANYVKVVDLAGWQTLSELTPEHYESNYALSGIRTTRDEKIDTFDRFHKPGPTEAEYLLLTAAGIANGIIKDAFPYEVESTIIQKVRPMLSTDVPDGLPWFADIFGDDVTSQNVSSDRKFCQLLRAGISDAYVSLLLTLIPNLSDVFIRGLEKDVTSLAIPRPSHGFKALRKLKIGCIDMQYAWGIDYIEK